MKPEVLTLIATLSGTFLGGLITIVITLIRSRSEEKRHYRQLWWEQKANAYSRIVDALSNLVYYLAKLCDNEIECRSLLVDERSKINEHIKIAYNEIGRVTASGAFLISREASTALQKMLKEKYGDANFETYFDYIDSEYGSAKDCLSTIVGAAKKDLSVP